MPSLKETLQQFVQIFEEMQIPYAVMGGLAVRLYAIPRPTYDVDFTIAIARERLPALYDALEAAGYTVGDEYRKGWTDTIAGMPLIKTRLYLENGRGIDVDIFLAESDFQQKLLSRRKRELFDERPVCFVTAEDLILLKLVASRPRDIADVTDVLFTQGRLDVEYMRSWAVRLQITEALERVLHDAAENE